MAKTTRTPYNASRFVTKVITSNTTLGQRNTGTVIFLDNSEAIDLTLDFLDNGSYFKIVKRNANSAAFTISSPSFSGVLLHDVGAGIVTTQVSGEQINLPQSACAGSYIDLVCDGQKWYVMGLSEGGAWTVA